jgi:predicted transcriptional regulator
MLLVTCALVDFVGVLTARVTARVRYQFSTSHWMIALCKKMKIPEPSFQQRGGQFVLIIRRKKKASPKAQPITQEVQGPSQDQVEILRRCEREQKIGDLMSVLGRTNRTKFRTQVLHPLVELELIALTVPEKPQSSKQKYRLTEKGAAYLRKLKR